MNKYEIVPKVDETQEFLEIANDFANPLELVRESISNAFDANATLIQIEFSVEKNYGDKQLLIILSDNGDGMDRDGLQSFFDLGNSLRRGDHETIGEKGHGTKVYFNSDLIEVTTHKRNKSYKARVEKPYKKLHDRVIPLVEVQESPNTNNYKGTEIQIKGYNNNRREKFTHHMLKDYIMWFTKFGSVENQFGIESNRNVKLRLKGVDKDKAETIEFGHYFPEESKSVDDLFETHVVRAPDYFCRRVVKSGQLKNSPEVKFDAVFSIEGTRVKYEYNNMLRRPGYKAPEGAYTVQDRYGIWLCKDHIPIQRKNNWVTKKGSEYTKFHAFINCQDLKLTANRGSIENTPHEILEDLKKEVERMYEEITSSDDWMDIEWLEDEAYAFKTKEKEKRNSKNELRKLIRVILPHLKNTYWLNPKEKVVFLH